MSLAKCRWPKVCRSNVGWPNVYHVSQVSVGKMSVGQVSFGQMSVHQMLGKSLLVRYQPFQASVCRQNVFRLNDFRLKVVEPPTNTLVCLSLEIFFCLVLFECNHELAFLTLRLRH